MRCMREGLLASVYPCSVATQGYCEKFPALCPALLRKILWCCNSLGMIEKTCIANLLAVATAYAKATRTTFVSVSRRFYGNAAAFGGLKSGVTSVTLRQYDKVMAAMTDAWPAGAEWPYLTAVTFPRPSTLGKSGKSFTPSHPESANQLSHDDAPKPAAKRRRRSGPAPAGSSHAVAARKARPASRRASSKTGNGASPRHS